MVVTSHCIRLSFSLTEHFHTPRLTRATMKSLARQVFYSLAFLHVWIALSFCSAFAVAQFERRSVGCVWARTLHQLATTTIGTKRLFEVSSLSSHVKSQESIPFRDSCESMKQNSVGCCAPFVITACRHWTCQPAFRGHSMDRIVSLALTR